jgi:hypothetical protein
MAARTAEAPVARLIQNRTAGKEPRAITVPDRPPHGFVSLVSTGRALNVVAQNGVRHRFSVPVPEGSSAVDAVTPLLNALGKVDPNTNWVTFGAAGLNGDGRDVAAETWLRRGASTILFDDVGADIEPETLLSRIEKKHSPDGIRQVDIDSDGRVRSSRLARWTDYKPVTRPDIWNENMPIIDNSIRALKNTVVIDDNTTAQAGGVAGMNHPKQRFTEDYIATQGERLTDGTGEPMEYRWLKKTGDIDPQLATKWGVDLQDPELLAKFGDVDPADGLRKINMFKLTKLRHNILQKVANPDDRYTEKYNNLYLAWSETQYENNLRPVLEQIRAEGKDIVLKLEDQQTLGQLRFIRRDFPITDPSVKIIYRNHIHIHAELASRPTTQQHDVAEFILQDLDHNIDLFMTHRSVDGDMGEFLFRDEQGNIDPRIADKVAYAVASFDDLDGLGRPLTDNEKPFLHADINHYLAESGQLPSDFSKPALGETNRWDPSKRKIAGIQAYAKFVQMMESAGIPYDEIPEYRTVGMGANDDPDGARQIAAYMLGLHPELGKREAYQKYLDPDRPDYDPFMNSEVDAIRTLFAITDADPRIADKIKLFRFTYDQYDDRHRRAIEETYGTARILSTAEACEDNASRFINDGTFVSLPRVGGMQPQVEQGVSGLVVEMTNDDVEFEAIARADFHYFTEINPYPDKRDEFRQRVKAALKAPYTTVYNVARELGAAALVKEHSAEIPSMIRQHLATTGEYPFVHDLLDKYKPKSAGTMEEVIWSNNQN